MDRLKNDVVRTEDRVSFNKNPTVQHDAFTAAGCEQIFIDTASGMVAAAPSWTRRCWLRVAAATSSWSQGSTGPAGL